MRRSKMFMIVMALALWPMTVRGASIVWEYVEYPSPAVVTVSDGITDVATFPTFTIQLTNMNGGYNKGILECEIGIGADFSVWEGHHLTPATAWLYTQFRSGTLEGYTGDSYSVSQLHAALFDLEFGNFIDNHYGDNLQARIWIDAALNSGWTDIGDVRILTLYNTLRDGSMQRFSDLLCMQAGWTPEPELPPVYDVTLEINSRVNLGSKGNVWATVRGTEDFDVRAIPEPGTSALLDGADVELLFAAHPTDWAYGDEDLDGYEDLLLKFSTQELSEFLTTSTEALHLMGLTGDGVFTGVGAVDVIDNRDKRKARGKHKGKKKGHGKRR